MKRGRQKRRKPMTTVEARQVLGGFTEGVELMLTGAARLEARIRDLQEQRDGHLRQAEVIFERGFRFARQHETVLTAHGKEAIFKLNGRRAGWRISPPEVVLPEGDEAELVAKLWRTPLGRKFIRTRRQLDRQKLKAAARRGRSLPRVVRVAQHTQFFAELKSGEPKGSARYWPSQTMSRNVGPAR